MVAALACRYFAGRLPGLTVERHLVMSSDVRAAIIDEFPKEYDRHNAMLDFFQNFAERGILSVSESPHEHPPDTMVARNSPVGMEMWDFRIYADTARTKASGNKCIRVCGGFACKDTFVALSWDYREDIGDQFNQFVEDTRAVWDDLFFPIAPFKGASIDEYLSNCYLAT